MTLQDLVELHKRTKAYCGEPWPANDRMAMRAVVEALRPQFSRCFCEGAFYVTSRVPISGYYEFADKVINEILGSDAEVKAAGGPTSNDGREVADGSISTSGAEFLTPAAAYVADHEQWCITRQVGNTEPCNCLGKAPAAAVCVWDSYYAGYTWDTPYKTGCGNVTRVSTVDENCHFCRKPILFKEPKP